MALGDLNNKHKSAIEPHNPRARQHPYLNHISVLPNLRTKLLVLTNKVPRHPNDPLRNMNALEVWMSKSHNVADLNSLSVSVHPRDQKPVASHVEGRVHGRTGAGLDGDQVLPDQRAAAESAGAIECKSANAAQVGVSQRISE